MKGIIGTIIPFYGTANNAHRINEVSADLEALTELVDAEVSSVSPELHWTLFWLNREAHVRSLGIPVALGSLMPHRI